MGLWWVGESEQLPLDIALGAPLLQSECELTVKVRSWVEGLTVEVVDTLFMDASSLALAVAFHAMRSMYLRAERLLAKVAEVTLRITTMRKMKFRSTMCQKSPNSDGHDAFSCW